MRLSKYFLLATVSLACAGVTWSQDSLINNGNFLGSAVRHDTLTCPCQDCQRARQKLRYPSDPNWRACTNTLGQYEKATQNLRKEKADLEKTIRLKKAARYGYTNETARLNIVSTTLDAGLKRMKEHQAKKALIEQSFQNKQ